MTPLSAVAVIVDKSLMVGAIVLTRVSWWVISRTSSTGN